MTVAVLGGHVCVCVCVCLACGSLTLQPTYWSRLLLIARLKTVDHTGSDGVRVCLCHCFAVHALRSMTLHLLYIKQVQNDNCINLNTEQLNNDFISIVCTGCFRLSTAQKYLQLGKRFPLETL